MIDRKTAWRVRPNPGRFSYMQGVIGYYMRDGETNGLDLHQARRYLRRRLLEGGYVGDEKEGMLYAQHFVVTLATVRRDLQRASRRAALSKGRAPRRATHVQETRHD